MNQKITLLLCIMFLYSVCLLRAQTPPIKQWDNTIGGNRYDWCRVVQQTVDGGYIVGGYSRSDSGIDKTEGNRGDNTSSDFWIVKIDSNGIKQWDKTFGGNRNDYLSCLQQTTDGGYILGGTSDSDISGDKTDISRGGPDYWLVKIDANGTKQWDKCFGGTDADVLNSLYQTADGGYILGGYSYSKKNGDKSQGNLGNSDWWVVKINSIGIKEWDKTFGSTSTDNLYSLQQTRDGGYILGGEIFGLSNYLIKKVNRKGVEQWTKTFMSGVIQVVQQTTEGGYILGGRSYSGLGGDKTDTSRGDFDFWMIKTDASGAKLWDKTFGGNGIDFCTSLQQTKDGGYVIAGWTNSSISGEVTEESRGGYDYWVLKTNGSGVKEWDKRIGGSWNDNLHSIRQTTSDGYILAGTSTSEKSGDKSEGGPGLENYWVVKLCIAPQTRITRSGTLDLCLSGSVTLSALQVQGGQYQWFKNTVAILGATATSYTATEVGKYKYTVTVPGGCTASSVTLTISNSCAKTIKEIAAFPNPSNGIVSVSYHSTINEQVNIYVFNKAGLPVFNGVQYVTKGSNSFTLNLSGLINGAYTLQINGNKTQTRMNLIIQK